MPVKCFLFKISRVAEQCTTKRKTALEKRGSREYRSPVRACAVRRLSVYSPCRCATSASAVLSISRSFTTGSIRYGALSRRVASVNFYARLGERIEVSKVRKQRRGKICSIQRGIISIASYMARDYYPWKFLPVSFCSIRVSFVSCDWYSKIHRGR